MAHTFNLMERLSTLVMSGEGLLQPPAGWIIDNRTESPDMRLTDVATAAQRLMEGRAWL